MRTIYTIGSNKKTAEEFFGLLQDNNINEVVDIRLNNRSQIVGFTKVPNLEYFLREICDIRYVHDVKFTPSAETLGWYKQCKKKSDAWERYITEFNRTMRDRDINNYIRKNYSGEDTLCLLCSEEKAGYCHRSLVAERFVTVWPGIEIKHL